MMEELVKILEEKLEYKTHKVEESGINIYAKSSVGKADCPYCGKESDKVHLHYERKIQDLPIQGKKVQIYLEIRNYFCYNADCRHKTFAERFSFYEPKARRTKRLQAEILRVSLKQSSVSASEYLRTSVVNVGKSTICNLLERGFNNVDNFSVKAVYIDDFALKKRQRYGTIMVDYESRRIIDMIETRETESVASWLSEYPNIKFVSRDGSQSYASAITKGLPQAVQISDRFHLLQGICDRANKCFQRIFKGRISIPITSESGRRRQILSLGTIEEKAKLVQSLFTEGRTKSEIEAITSLSGKTVKKYLLIKDCPIEKNETVRGKEHKIAVDKVQARANLVKCMKADGISINEISRRTGFTKNTIKVYLSDDFSPINGHYGKRREGKLYRIRENVPTMRAQGKTYSQIFEIIRRKGMTVQWMPYEDSFQKSIES